MDYTEQEVTFLLAGLDDLAARDVIWEGTRIPVSARPPH